MARATTPESPVEAPLAVTLTLLGDPADVARIDESMREVVARQGLTVRSAPTVLARITIDLRSSPVSVVVTDGRGAMIVRREIPRSASNEVLREELALIVADALDVARAAEAARPPPPPPIASASAAPTVERRPEPPAPSSPMRADVAGFFVARSRDTSAYASLGAGLGVRVEPGTDDLHPTLGATVDAAIPYDATTRDVELRVAPYALRLTPGVSARAGRVVDLEASAGVGVDVVHVTSRAAAPGVAAFDATTRISPILAPALGARFRLGSARLTATAGLDVDLARRRYVVDTPQGSEQAWRSWAVHPMLSVGVAFPFAGGDGE